MKIADVEAIVPVWSPSYKSFWNALWPINRVSNLAVPVHTGSGVVVDG